MKPRGRAPFLDNTPLVSAGILALVAALVGLLVLANRSTALAPDFPVVLALLHTVLDPVLRQRQLFRDLHGNQCHA